MSAPARYEWTCPVMRVLGVDPGSTHSALVIIDTTTRRPRAEHPATMTSRKP